MSWIAQGFVNVISSITSILNLLNPLSDTFILNPILDFLAGLIEGLTNALEDLFVFLFVPSQQSFTNISNIFNDKLGFVSTIKSAIDTIFGTVLEDVEPSSSLSYSVETDIYTGNISIDFSWFSRFKPYTDLFITAFVYLGFVWRLFHRLPSIISGFNNKEV